VVIEKIYKNKMSIKVRLILKTCTWVDGT